MDNSGMNYDEFLREKQIKFHSHGIDISPEQIHPMLFPFQRDLTLWALRKGRAAIFADTGLGKTFCQIEWARLISRNAIIVAPLSVSRQTIKEAEKIGVNVKYAKSQSDVTEDGIWITNYERIESFDASKFDAVVLDESSILKSLDGETRKTLTKMFSQTSYRLCCTATPAPNDRSEIGNHAEFLGVCTMQEMLAMFFIHANKVEEIRMGNYSIRKKLGNKRGTEWRLKNYAKDAFFRWLASWGMFIRKPSDLGYKDDGFELPALNIKPLFVDIPDYKPDDQLFFTGLHGVSDRNKIRARTENERSDIVADLINQSNEQWIIWCGLNTESDLLQQLLPDSVAIAGSDDPETKSEAFEAFQNRGVRTLVTKPKIAGFGMNFQNAHNMIFFGINDSWESYYQCIRREWRFGQKYPVNVYVVTSELEREIFENVKRKESVADEMATELIRMIKIYEQEELGKVDNIESIEYSDNTPFILPVWLESRCESNTIASSVANMSQKSERQ